MTRGLVIVGLLVVLALIGCTFEAGVEPVSLTAGAKGNDLAAPGEAVRLEVDGGRESTQLEGEGAAGRLDEDEAGEPTTTATQEASPTPSPQPTSSPQPPPTATLLATPGAGAAAVSTPTPAIFDFPPPTPAGPPPEITTFTGSPTVVGVGGTVTLSWEADGDTAELWVQSPRGTLRQNYGPVPISGTRTITLDPAWGPQVNFGLSVHRIELNYTTTRQVDVSVRCTPQPDGLCLPYTPSPTPTLLGTPTPSITRTPLPTPSGELAPTATQAPEGEGDSL